MSETTIQAATNGPLLVKGTVELKDGNGNPVQVPGEAFALCRCGHSAKKPFCDGSHRKAGFQA